MKRFILLFTVLALSLISTPAQADDTPSVPWTGNNQYIFAVGDSILEQCREDFGMGARSLGFVGWPGATSTQMRERLSSSTEGWPYTTESSNAQERIWFRDAGSLVVALGTNDVKFLTAEQYRANIDWFMQQSRGRPVQWFNIYNKPYEALANVFNAELSAATNRWPNLKIMDWNRQARENPGILSDGVHVTTYEVCVNYRNRLIQMAAPHEPGKNAPVGYWYYDPAKSGPVNLNGWGAGNERTRRDPIQLNIRANWNHVGRYPISSSTGDPWAQAASGRAFGIQLSSSYRGAYVCVDLLDAAGRFTYLGCRTM